MSNRAEVESLLNAVEILRVEAAQLQGQSDDADLPDQVARWKSKAGPQWGEVSGRVPKLLKSLDDARYEQEQTRRMEELRAEHDRAVRRLQRLEAESSRPTGTEGFEELYRSIHQQAENLERRFVEMESNVFDRMALEALDFDTRLGLSAFEREVTLGSFRELSINEGLEVKKLMGHLRDFRKGAISDLGQHLRGEHAVTARRQFLAPTRTAIPASVAKGSRPWTGDLAGKSGLYYQAYPNGQLKLLARVKNGLAQRSLFLAPSYPEGRYSTRSELECFNSNGTIEVSGSLYEGDPKPSGISFHAWAMSRLSDVAR